MKVHHNMYVRETDFLEGQGHIGPGATDALIHILYRGEANTLAIHWMQRVKAYLDRPYSARKPPRAVIQPSPALMRQIERQMTLAGSKVADWRY